jgi:serine/threonine protein kinase
MPPLDQLEGVVLPRGHYELIERVAVTNMSVVYRAVNLSNRMPVAVKVLKDEHYLQRFRNEAEITYGLNVPNIASTLSYNIDTGEVLADGSVVKYIVMKWLSSRRDSQTGAVSTSLSDFMRNSQGKTTEELLDFAGMLLQKLAPALDRIHSHKIFHRDIKPANILFNTDRYEQNEPYLIDFGIAKQITPRDVNETAPEGQTAAYERPGTSNYMPFEQWFGVVESQTDQYALGVTIYELLADRMSPFKKAVDKALEDNKTPLTSHPSRTEIQKRKAWQDVHEKEPPTDIREYRPDIPKEVWKVLKTALSKRMDDRYPSIGEFAQAFVQSVKEARATKPAPPPADNIDEDATTVEMPDTSAAKSVESPTLPQTPLGNRRHQPFPLIWIGAGALIVAVLLMGGMILPLLSEGEVTPTPTPPLVVAVTQVPILQSTEIIPATAAPTLTLTFTAVPTDSPTNTITLTQQRTLALTSTITEAAPSATPLSPTSTNISPQGLSACQLADLNWDGSVGEADLELFETVKIGTEAGADGYQLSHDLNQDGVIDVKDFTLLLAEMDKRCDIVATLTPCQQTDVDVNGVVDEVDLALFDEMFGARFGDAKYQTKYDFTQDGVVDLKDQVLMNAQIGRVCN